MTRETTWNMVYHGRPEIELEIELQKPAGYEVGYGDLFPKVKNEGER
jgi:hypothetical protein